MRYEGTVYRPPSEAGSLLIQATIGCPHNKCTFCPLYKNTRFRVRSVEDIKKDMDMAQGYYGEYIESIFFPDGNTIIMKTDQLLEIFNYAHELFPHLQRITVYGSARFVNKKSEEDLKKLREAGLKRIHMGMESGDDIVLERVKKGATAEEIISAGQKLKKSGMEVSEYYLTGIGGKDRSREHAINSARVLNQICPDFIRIRTFVPQPGTPLYDDYMAGNFQLLTAHEALQENRLLVEHLECEGSVLLSDHIANFCNINGLLMRDKEKMLKEIDMLLELDETCFRPPHISSL